MKTMTDKQAAALAKAELKLPTGWSYRIHDDNDRHEKVKVWGVTVYDENEENIAHGQNNGDGATYVEAGEKRAAARLALNRAMAALWHKQPCWAA